MKKFLKIAIICISACFLAVCAFGGFYFYSAYSSAKNIDISFENNLDKFVFLEFYDKNNNKTPHAFTDFCEGDKIPEHVFMAFVAKEDRRFYTHNGIDFRGILRATATNLKSGKTLQGGSTITQQLAKNLALSSEKKLSRKISEVFLSREIENRYSKEEILTMYLNVIYFGENTFGISDASMLYFGKTPSELTISEGAMLAGIIASPENYSPVKSIEVATAKRDIVLALMRDEGYISSGEYEKAREEELILNLTKSENINYDYFNYAIKESAEVLGISESELSRRNYKIFTYIDLEKQKSLHEVGGSNASSDGVLLALDNESAGVLGVFESRHDMICGKRAPASLVKPLLVYGPALEENVIFEESIIEDKKTDFSGYSPKNYMDIYYGDVTAKTALAKSLNVPSVKILESLSIKKAKSYAKKLNLPLADEDSGLAIALGGLFEGFSPLQISAGYQTVARGGEYQKPRFVREITSENGEIIYSAKNDRVRVFGEDTAYILTDMLKECTRDGTGKKLFEVSPFIASKTGTNGDEYGNFDAYCCSYTCGETFFCWLGNADFSRIDSSVKGSSLPTEFAVKYFSGCGEICDFEMPKSVEVVAYDRDEYLKNGKLLLATADTPEKYIGKTLISKRFAPMLKSLKYSYPRVLSPSLTQSGDFLEIEFTTQEFATYEIFNSETKEKVAEILGDGGVSSTVLPAEGEFAKFEICAKNSSSGKAGERYVFEKLYLKKDFLPQNGGNSEKLKGSDMPTTDEDILEFFS